jgi:hypothetical protein
VRLRRVIGGICIAVLLVGGAVVANAVPPDNGVTATFSPADPNGCNGFYTSPVDITYEGSPGDTCNPASETYSGPNRASTTVSSTCTPIIGDPYTGTFPLKYDDARPVIAAHADIERKIRRGSGPIDVNYTEPGGQDDLDGNVAVNCNPPPSNSPSGSPFPVGSTTVTCIARDNAGNGDSTQFTITVAVDDPPTVNVPPNQTEEATSPAGAIVTFTATANDPEDDPDPGVTCSPDSGSTFALGATPVDCSARDSMDNVTTERFTVTVRDTTGPTFDPLPAPEWPGNTIGGYQSAPSDAGAYTKPTAQDTVDGGVLNVVCEPKGPGDFFPLGSTSIACTATDQRGNQSASADGRFTVRITDTTSPNFVVQPQDVVVQAANVNSGTPASNSCIQKFLNSPTAFDVVEGAVPVTNNGPAQFPMGQTTVTFTATDTRNPSTQGTAVVTIRRGPQGPCTIDARAPGNVKKLHIREGNKLVVPTWRNPLAPDFSHVEVYRQRASRSGLGGSVCRTRRTRCVDRNVSNGIQYRYAVFSVDEAGNYSTGRSGFATPHRIMLLGPRDGARISRPPVFDWVSIRGADYYNVQLYRVARGRDPKVLSRWPVRSRYALSWRWRQDRRMRRFVPGQYYWYVWPGFGSVRSGNYGKAMGPSDFRVVRRR